MASKLSLYNKALLYCKDRKIASLTEDREPRYLLDDVYDEGGIDACLEEAMWRFATRAVRLDYDTAVTPDFGYKYAFSKPTDWVKTVAMCSDEYYNVPLTAYVHEAGYWYSDLQEVYVRYVSDGNDYGYNIGGWPKSFGEYVAAHFANEIVGKLGGTNETIEYVMKVYEEKKKTAKSNDAWNQPTQFPAPGSWSNSRGGGRSGRWDRGSRSTLIG